MSDRSSAPSGPIGPEQVHATVPPFDADILARGSHPGDEEKSSKAPSPFDRIGTADAPAAIDPDVIRERAEMISQDGHERDEHPDGRVETTTSPTAQDADGSVTADDQNDETSEDGTVTFDDTTTVDDEGTVTFSDPEETTDTTAPPEKDETQDESGGTWGDRPQEYDEEEEDSVDELSPRVPDVLAPGGLTDRPPSDDLDDLRGSFEVVVPTSDVRDAVGDHLNDPADSDPVVAYQETRPELEVVRRDADEPEFELKTDPLDELTD